MQRGIVYTCVALHNFLNRAGGYLAEDEQRAERNSCIAEEEEEEDYVRRRPGESAEATLTKLREEISLPLWDDYRRYVENTKQ